MESAQLGEFDLLEEIGRGGMGIVYRARQRSLGRIVAVKVLPQDLAQQGNVAARFRAEAQRMAQLNHPNIAQVYSVGEQDGAQYFAMQYISGGTLQERLRSGPLPPEEAMAIAAQVADALDYAHRHGIIHRDIKPANIMFDEHGRPIVTDFGIAKAADDTTLTATGVSLGTPHYMAPEQVKGNPIDGRADVYALGAVLYEMVCGRPPFDADTPIGVAIKHLNDEPLPPRALCPGIPERLERIIEIALAKEPADRFASAGEMATALRVPGSVQHGSPHEREPSREPPGPTCYIVATPPRPAAAAVSPLAIVLVVLLAAVGLSLMVGVLVGRAGHHGGGTVPSGLPRPAPMPSQSTTVPPPPVPSLPATAGVPNVVGQPVDDARRTLEQAGFTVHVNEGRYSRYDRDRVASQEPSGGASVPRGDAVYIVPSLGRPEDMPLRTYSYPDLGFEIQFPDGWSVERSVEDGYPRVAATSPDGHATALVDASQGPGKADPLEDFRSMDERFSRAFSTYRRISLEPATLAGRSAGKWEFRMNWKDHPSHTVDVGVETLSRGYAVLVRAYDEDFDAYRGLFERILSSFRVL